MDRVSSADESEEMDIDLDRAVYCECGDFVLPDEPGFTEHKASDVHRVNFISNPPFTNNVTLLRKAFENRIAEYRIDANDSQALSYKDVLDEQKETLRRLIEFEIFSTGSIKAQITVFGVYENEINLLNTAVDEDPEIENIVQVHHMNTSFGICTAGSDFEEFYQQQLEAISERAEDFTTNGSGWTLTGFSHLTLSIAYYQPIKGSSYIPTPAYVAKKHSVINIQNKDNK